jgi:hypothetical protein
MNKEDKWQVEQKDLVTFDIPTAKFFKNLMDSYFITNNYEEFCVRQDIEYEDGRVENEIIAMCRIKLITSTILPDNVMTQNAAYLSALAIREDHRGIHNMPLINSLLIEAAEDAGIFLFGYARNYIIEIPVMQSVEDYNLWLDEGEKSSHNIGFKKDFARAKKLLGAYLDQGYCRYDLKGIYMGSNRKWKKTGFGYRSSKIDNDMLNKHLDNHLSCGV